MKKIQPKALALNVEKLQELTPEQSAAVSGGAGYTTLYCRSGVRTGSSITPPYTTVNYNLTYTTGW